MRDKEKPFILTRGPLGSFNITPRNAQGWRLMLGWIALSLPIMGAFALFSESQHSDRMFAAGLAGFLVAMGVWTIGGIMWMKARAEVVDIEKLLREKREMERKRRR